MGAITVIEATATKIEAETAVIIDAAEKRNDRNTIGIRATEAAAAERAAAEVVVVIVHQNIRNDSVIENVE